MFARVLTENFYFKSQSDKPKTPLSIRSIPERQTTNPLNLTGMRKHFFTCLTLFFIAGNLFSQQLLTAPYQWSPEQEIGLNELPGIALQKLVPCNRQAIVDDFNAVYLNSGVSSAQLAWTGSIANCTPGTTSDLSKTNTINRINYFRKLVGGGRTLSLLQG